MLNFIKLLLLSLFIASSTVFASSENNFSSEKMGTVQLLVGDRNSASFTGSGVIINNKLNIITNYHVVDTVISGEDKMIKVCFTYDEQKEPSCIGTAVVEKYDEEKDLALLNTYVHPDYLSEETVKPYYEKFKQNFNFALAQNINIADSIYVFGYPGIGGDTITYTSGKVSGFEDFYIKTDVKVSSGNSGGGAYNSKGEVIGLVTAVSGGQGNIGWIVKSSEIKNFLANTIFDKNTNSDSCGLHQYKTGRYNACQCEIGFKFDGAKINCIPRLTHQGCGTMKSHSIFNPASGTSCTCQSGYVWENPDDDADFSCIPKKEVTCEDIYGANVHENLEDNLCYCNAGYEWDGEDEEGNNTCVVELEMPDNDVGCADGYIYSSFEDRCIENSNLNVPPKYFWDIDSNEINKAGIDYVSSRGLVNGYDDGTFKPGNKITRAEFTKIVLLAKYSSDEISRSFSYNTNDVYPQDWYYHYVNFAKQKSIINGYSDNTFHPNDEISFAEASKILVNTLIGYREIGYGEKWWLPFTQALIDRNVKQFDLSYALTRGDMATLMYQILR